MKPIILFFLLLTPCLGKNIYHIGNSHTWDFKPSTGFREMVASQGKTIVNDWHINCGSSLYLINLVPTRVCLLPESFGTWQPALSANQWDAVVLQPHRSPPGIWEKDAAKSIIEWADANPMNSNTTYYIFASWPTNESPEDLAAFDYSAAYMQPFNFESNQWFVMQREFHYYLIKALSDEIPGVKLESIPVAEVIHRFHLLAQGGGIPGFTGAGELYRDIYHLNNIGSYLAALTIYAVIYEADPRIVGPLPGYEPGASPTARPLTPELAATIGELVFQTLRTPPYVVGPEETNLQIACPQAGSVEITFKTYTGYEYSLLGSSDLATWTPLTGTIEGDSQVMQLNHSATDVNSYFRVVYDLP